MFKKLFSIFFALNIFLLPIIATAQSESSQNGNSALANAPTASISRTLNKIQEDYNAKLVSELSRVMFENPIIGWNSGGLVKTLFTICFCIALVQALSNKSPNGMVMDMAKLAFYTWLVLAMIGVSGVYTKFSFLTVPDTKSAKYTSDSRSLDADIFNFVAYQADTLADELFKAGGPEMLAQSMRRSNIMIKNMMNANQVCQAGNTFCFSQFKSEDELIDPKTVQVSEDGPAEPQKKGLLEKGLDAITPDAMAKLVDLVSSVIGFFSDLTFMMFYIITWIVDLVRAVITQFLLIAFGIITGISFFIAKLFVPFAVIPKYRGKVFQALKIPLSAALYGFASSLIVFVSGACFAAMNTAASKVIYDRIMSGGAGAELAIVIPNVIISMMAGMILVTVLQIVAITKVPTLCKDIMNLSMDSLVNFAAELGKTVSTALTTVAGGIITGGVTFGAGVAGGAFGALIGGAKGAIGGAAQGLGFKSPFGGGAGFSGFSGGKGGGPSPAGGGGGAGKTVGGVHLASTDSVSQASPNVTAAKLAQQESLIPKDGGKKGSGDNGGGYSKKDASILEKAASADATDEDREKAQEVISNKKRKELANDDKKPDFLATVIGAATGDSGAIHSYFAKTSANFSNKLQSKAKSSMGMEEGDNLKMGLSRRYANKRDSMQTATSNFTAKRFGLVGNDAIEATESASSRMSRSGITDDQSATVSSAISDFQKNGEISSEAKNDLFNIRRSSDITDDAQRKVVDKIVNEDAMEAQARIKAGQFDESDLEKVYKMNNTDFKSKDFNKQMRDVLKNEEYANYAAKNNKINAELMNTLSKKGLNSDKGIEASEGLQARLDQGMIARDQYRNNMSTEIDKIKPKIDNTMQTMAKVESKEAISTSNSIDKMQAQIQRMEQDHAKRQESNPHTNIQESDSLKQLRSDLQEALVKKQALVASLASRVESNPRSYQDEKTRQRLTELGISTRGNDQYGNGLGIDDILAQENPALHNRQVNREQNTSRYNDSYNTSKGSDFNIGGYTFSRNGDGSIDSSSYEVNTGYTREKRDHMVEAQVQKLEAELQKRKSLLSNYDTDSSYKDVEIRKYGAIAAEIEALEEIIRKYKK